MSIDMNLREESSENGQMAAYAAVVSLNKTLNEALLYNPIEVPLDCASEYVVFLSQYNNSDYPRHREALESVFRAADEEDLLAKNPTLEPRKVSSLWSHLSKFLYRCEQEDFIRIQSLKQLAGTVEFSLKVIFKNEKERTKLQILAYEAEDLVDLHMSNAKSMSYLNQRIHAIKSEFEFLIQWSWMRDWRTIGTNDFVPGHSLCSVSSQNTTTMNFENNLVGFDDDLIKIKEQLYGFPPRLTIVSIVGMGGIGKTTLARIVYDDPYIEHHFYIRAWMVISRDYELRKVLLGILSSVSHSADDEMFKNSNEQLGEQLYRCLKGRRYLIVLDDIWDIEAWNNVKQNFPDDNNGSRIIFTSRRANICSLANTRGITHDVHLLDMDHSLKLLSLKVFGTESFPLELETIGKRILEKCHGLPLAVVVVAGVLVKINKTTKSWENVAKSEELLDILGLSYKCLPPHLKLCFLYIGALLKDEEISVMRIIRVLVAEGFVGEIEGETMEEVAEGYLEDLISRSLLMATKRGYNGRVIKCNMHDLLRDLSIREARREKFLHVSISPDAQVSRMVSHSDIDWNDYKHFRKHLIRSFLAIGRVQPLLGVFGNIVIYANISYMATLSYGMILG